MFPNVGMSDQIEKIETFISENLKIFGFDPNILIWTPPHTVFSILYSLCPVNRCLRRVTMITYNLTTIILIDINSLQD